MNIPNSLTLSRIVLVPLVVWLIITHEMLAAFLLFLFAGLSDAADGFLAKRYNWDTELGAYLDPIADKALLVSIYVTLGLAGQLPAWLVIAVVSRDILIVGAVVLSWMLSRPLSMHPLLISKANTFSQIVLAGLVLAELGLGLGLEEIVQLLVWVTGTLTIVSAAAYFMAWLRHMASYEPRARAALCRISARAPGMDAPQQSVRGSGLRDSRPAHPRSAPSRGARRRGFPRQRLQPRGGKADQLLARLAGPRPTPDGPPASGKTHLARVFQALSGARALEPSTLDIGADRHDGRGDAARGRGCRPSPPTTRRRCFTS